MKEQIELFHIFKEKPDLLKEYEQIKLASNGIAFREYMRRKYEFFNKVLGGASDLNEGSIFEKTLGLLKF